MINFISTDTKKIQALAKLRRVVMTVTSGILGIYILIAAGFLGWSAWITFQASRTTTDHGQVLSELNLLRENEVVARALGERAKKIEDFLVSRGDASDEAFTAIKENFKMMSWDYIAGASSVVRVAATDPATLKTYQDYMEENYTVVQTSKVEWKADEGWTLTLTLTGRKKV